MSVRRVPINWLHPTGIVSSAAGWSTHFEGLLERDFYTLLRFDPDVVNVEDQPICLYLDPNDRRRRYTPDALVTYRPESGRKPLLAEVKKHSFLNKNWKTLRPGFKAAVRHCRSNGWEFHIFTEKHIRGPYLQNVQLLLQHEEPVFSETQIQRVLRATAVEGGISFRDLLSRESPACGGTGLLLSLTYHLICTKRLQTDMESVIGYEHKLTSILPV